MTDLTNTKKLNPEKYDSDKKTMLHYVKNYEEYFYPIMNEPVKLLELGVLNGGSVMMWRDYFEYGTIVGLDSKNVSIEDHDRIYLYQGFQEDTNLLTRIGEERAPEGFDIIIDDCSHIAKYTRTSFWHLFDHHLKHGGIYVIEDWGTGYSNKWPDGKTYEGTLGQDSKNPGNHLAGMVGFIKELIDECGAPDVTRNELAGFYLRDSKIAKIYFSVSHCFVFKK